MADVTLGTLVSKVFNHIKTIWRDKMVDPEGDRTDPGVKITATRLNNIENSVELAHDRLNDTVEFLKSSDRIQKNLRFEFLLLKASITSGLTSNILVENFETLNGITLISGNHNETTQTIYIP